MNRPCPDIETLGELLTASAEDPRLEHVRSCVRCRNLLEGLREFQSPESDLPATEIHQAEERMRAALDRALDAQEGIADAGRRGQRTTLRSPWARAWSALFAAGWWRPALGAALVVVIAVTAMQFFDREAQAPPEVLRSDASDVLPGIALKQPRMLAQGGLHLAWEAHPGAETYQVIFHDLRLAKRGSFAAGPETTVTLTSADLQTLGSAGEQLLWRVVALRGEGEVADSPPAGITLP
jgi:hypothetical protein